MKKLNNKKGFTIVELVIVIAVIGILAGVLIPTFSGIQQSAKESAAFQECKNVLSSVLALNEGAIPAKTLFSVNSDKDASTIEYNFIYENQKLGNNTKDVTSNRAALNLSSETGKQEYKIYVLQLQLLRSYRMAYFSLTMILQLPRLQNMQVLKS